MRVLVTRAQPEAEETAARLRTAGHEAIVSPALVIQALAFDFDRAGVQAVLFTSAAGVRALGLQPFPALVVGDGAAAAARAAGYGDVRSARGAGADLVGLARGLDPRAGTLVHVSGEDLATDVAGALRQAGFDARRLIAYRAARAADLSAPALAALAADPPSVDIALFHSLRGLESFVALARKQGLAGRFAHIQAACLSARIAHFAETQNFQRVVAAAAPSEAALLQRLESLGSPPC